MNDRLLTCEDTDALVPQPARTNVIPFRKGARPEPVIDANTVKLCEDILDRARRGVITGIAVATAYPDAYSTGTAFTGGPIGNLLVGCLRLQRRLDDYDERH